MSIGPILTGRLPANLIAKRLSNNLQRSARLLQNLQDQASTGQKYFIPSEDPASAVRTVFLQSTLERKEQFRVNLQTDQALLSTTENALAPVSDVLNRAKSLLLTGLGDTTTSQEKEALAAEIGGLIQSVINVGNTRYQGRYLFGGSQVDVAPFEQFGNGVIRYNGDRQGTESFLDFDIKVANNIDGVAAFAPLTEPVGSDVNPALTLNTRLDDLLGGSGVQTGEIQVTVDTGTPVTQTVDLTNAETIGDVKTLIEAAFPPGTLTVGIIAPPNSNGLTITPAAGTVAVSDLPGQLVARQLGIDQGPAASITGSDLDPALTLQTPLSAFNNGAGATTANGLFITNGSISKAVDISSANTVEDLFNILETENLELELRINDDRTGLAIASRLSGGVFSIGENGGTDATSLGIRTLNGGTLLSELNFGLGVPVNNVDADGNLLPAEIEIVRRDGSVSTVDLKGLVTIQEVLNAITAVDADLTASLNAVGNGISITDTSGTGPLEVRAGVVADALGLTGIEPGSNNTVPLTGQDVNQRRSNGVLSLLVQLETALNSGDDRALERLDPLFNQEIERFNVVRGEIGSRLNLLETVKNRLQDEDVVLQEQLSAEFDVDMTEVISRIALVSSTLQATLNIAASTLNLTLLNFL